MSNKGEKLTAETTTNHVNIKQFLLRYNAIILFVVLLIGSSMMSSSFLTKGNIFNVLRQHTPYIIMSMGMLLTILTGGIDLSVGAVAGVGGIVAAKAMMEWKLETTGSIILVLLITLLVGAVIGAINGTLVSKFKLAPFIITLAAMTTYRGVAYILSGGQPIRLPDHPPSSGLLTTFGSASDPILGVPYPIWLGLLVVVVFFLLMKYTGFGRYVIATGSNEDALRLAGINVKRYKISVYMISSALATLAGTVIASRAAIATPIAGDGLELDIVAGCVIGGASLSGGKGTVLNTVIGVMIIALIGNIMNLMSIAIYPQQVIKGLIIVVSVLIRAASDKEKA